MHGIVELKLPKVMVQTENGLLEKTGGVTCMGTCKTAVFQI